MIIRPEPWPSFATWGCNLGLQIRGHAFVCPGVIEGRGGRARREKDLSKHKYIHTRTSAHPHPTASAEGVASSVLVVVTAAELLPSKGRAGLLQLDVVGVVEAVVEVVVFWPRACSSPDATRQEEREEEGIGRLTTSGARVILLVLPTPWQPQMDVPCVFMYVCVYVC